MSLESAIKELIENGIDAGATSIEIRFRDHGLTGVEVRDNGHGIDQKDFEALALRSATSKIKDFEDVGKVASYGFRGEALGSLAAMAELSVITSTEPPMGHRLEYGPQGNLVSRTPLARERGTTVAFRELFKPFPVRLAEFRKNVKREYAKAVSLIQAYGIVRSDVRFICSNQNGKEKAVPIFSTQTSRSMRDNIAAVFGPGVVEKLAAADATLDAETGATIAGFVSKVTAGSGRNSSDRVFLWINKRPCELPKSLRAINECYRLFNQQSYPMVFLDLTLPPESYDVNVTPDKRTILLHNEQELLESLKAAVTNVFERSGTEYPRTQNPPSGAPPASGRPVFPSLPPSPGKRGRQSSKTSISSGDKTPPSQAGSGTPHSTKATPIKSRIRERVAELQYSPTEPVVIVDSDNVDEARKLLSPPAKRKRGDVLPTSDPEERRPSSASAPASTQVPPSLHLQNTAIRMNCSLERLRRAQQVRSKRASTQPAVVEKSEITADAEASEALLTKNVSKDDFGRMEIIGQFNLGFIIVRLPNEDFGGDGPPTADLFIVDQHASDEKYNYETLGAGLSPIVQMLMAPQPLSLSSTEQLVVSQNMDAILRNGFQVSVDDQADPSQRFRLRGVPNFGGTILGLPGRLPFRGSFMI